MNEIFDKETKGMNVEEKAEYLLKYHKKHNEFPDNFGMIATSKTYKRTKNKKEIILSPITTFYSLHLLVIGKYISKTFNPLLFSKKGCSIDFESLTVNMQNFFYQYYQLAEWSVMPSTIRRSMALLVDGLCAYSSIDNTCQSQILYRVTQIMKTGSNVFNVFYQGKQSSMKDCILKSNLSEFLYVIGEGVELDKNVLKEKFENITNYEKDGHHPQLAKVVEGEEGDKQNYDCEEFALSAIESNQTENEKMNRMLIEKFKKMYGKIPETNNFVVISLKNNVGNQVKVVVVWYDEFKKKLMLTNNILDRLMKSEDKKLKIDPNLKNLSIIPNFSSFDVVEIIKCDAEFELYELVIKDIKGIKYMNGKNIKRVDLKILNDFVFKKISLEYEGSMSMEHWKFAFRTMFLKVGASMGNSVVLYDKNQIENAVEKRMFLPMRDFLKMLNVKMYFEYMFEKQSNLSLKMDDQQK